MAGVPRIHEYKYKNGVLIRSVMYSWSPGKWPLGPGAYAQIANGPSGIFTASVYLTVVTAQGDIHVMEATTRKENGRAHRMAAEINRDAMASA